MTIRTSIPWVLRVAVCGAIWADSASAQARGGSSDAPSGRVSGVVYDSIARRPLADAMVQMALEGGAESRNVRTDARGRFRLDSVVPGNWLVQVAHPRTDSLGLASFTRSVRVKPRGTTNAEVGLPSTFGYLRSLCGIDLAGDTLGVLTGTVTPVAGAAPVAGGIAVYWRRYPIAHRCLGRCRSCR